MIIYKRTNVRRIKECEDSMGKNEITIRSSAAEYLTYIASVGDDETVFEVRYQDENIYDGSEIEIISDGIYRSLHYIIKYKGYYVEIQGRTLFEEGWSEIDHDIVYPYNTDDVMLKDFSTLLNRLSGMADEMSSYFRRMKEDRENTIF